MWTKEQSNRLAELLEEQEKDPSSTWVGYWNSDQHGRPANGGSSIHISLANDTCNRICAYPGAINELYGELRICSNGFHATREPHQWQGCRVWIVALIGKRVDQGNKSAGVRREIIGEVLPEECLDARIGVRIGRKDLDGSNLEEADLREMNLFGALLEGANLKFSNFDLANLGHANLKNANLEGAHFGGTNLLGANLCGANLKWANLYCVNMEKSNLCGANLDGANLRAINLDRCYLGAKERPKWLPFEYEYEIDSGYILKRTFGKPTIEVHPPGY